LAGLAIAKQTGLPWLADLRDPWTNIYYNKALPRTAATKAKDYAWESEVVASADAVTVVSPGMADEFGPRAKRLEVIYNGYDSEDLPAHRPTPHPEFTLSHVGNFFPSLDSPGLVEALARLVKTEPGFGQDLQIRFTGLLDTEVEARFREAGLGDMLVVTPPVSHQFAVVEMLQATVLLFALTKEGENVRGLVSGKIFEYLATGLPILAIGSTQSGAYEVMSAAGRTNMYSHNDADGIYQELKKLYHTWKVQNNTPIALDTTQAERFSRKGLTQQLSILLDSIKKK
jgi:glycosyltransferase involved in cell wall biosynthesis